MRTRIKICGITRPDQAHWAIDAGADAIGLVFYPPSVRAVDINMANTIVSAVTPMISVVGVFADQPEADIATVCEQVPLDILQFHGDESASFCRGFSRPWFKGVRMRPELSLEHTMTEFDQARGVLVDTYKSGIMGGTGTAFDWSRLEGVDRNKLILAGGLTADNVRQALETVNPVAIDVSTGVESAPGVKDPERIKQFMNAARESIADGFEFHEGVKQ